MNWIYKVSIFCFVPFIFFYSCEEKSRSVFKVPSVDICDSIAKNLFINDSSFYSSQLSLTGEMNNQNENNFEFINKGDVFENNGDSIRMFIFFSRNSSCLKYIITPKHLVEKEIKEENLISIHNSEYYLVR